MNHVTNQLWVEKYRPQKVEDCILPDRIKKIAQGFIQSDRVPHLILAGTAGTGKTTMAKALCRELDYEVLFINGSLDANLATLRDDVTQFASAMSLEGRRKCVMIDEGDYLSTAVMAAMRTLMESLSANCSFIITCNFPNRILDAIISRCSVIDFTITKDEYQTMSAQAYKRVCQILEAESVEYDKPTVGKLVLKYYPDMRKTLNELQRYSSTGKIDSGVFASGTDGEFKDLIPILAEKNFAKMRKWVAMASTVDFSSLVRYLYNNMTEFADKKASPQMLLHLADYQYKVHFVADREIHIAAMLTEVMMAE